MTTTFDALQKLIAEHRKQLGEDDFHILQNFIDAVHDIQHSENSHRIDTVIEKRIEGRPWDKHFQRLRQPSYEPKH
jgi:hypothetical protein